MIPTSTKERLATIEHAKASLRSAIYAIAECFGDPVALVVVAGSLRDLSNLERLRQSESETKNA